MNRSLLILVVVLVALFAVYYLVTKSEEASLRVDRVENLVGLDSALVNEMIIKAGDSSVIFKKQGVAWLVQHYGQFRPAEPGIVSQIVQIASSLTVGEIVSSNPEKQALYEVDEAGGRLVTFLRDGSAQGALVVGKTGSDFQSCYVRSPESDDVYLATINITRLVQRPVEQFRDKAIVKLDPMQISAVEIESPDYSYSVSPGDSLWQLTPATGESSLIDPQQMQSWLAQLSAVRINSFLSPDSAAAVDFSKPTAEVSISLSGGEVISIMFLKTGEDAADYLVKSSRSEEVYSVRDWVYNNLIKDPETLRLRDAA